MSNVQDKDNERRKDTAHNASLCKIRRSEMIKYSFGKEEEYVAIKECEYDDLTITNEDACRAYQEIFRSMDEGWMTDSIPEIGFCMFFLYFAQDLAGKEIKKVGEVSIIWNPMYVVVMLKYECVGDVVDFRTWLGISIRDHNNEYYGFRWSNLFKLNEESWKKLSGVIMNVKMVKLHRDS
nr:hypothetical protein [Tanacetum cinerariifolium]